MKTLKKLSKYLCNTIAVLGVAVCIFSTFYRTYAPMTAESVAQEDTNYEVTPLYDLPFVEEGKD